MMSKMNKKKVLELNHMIYIYIYILLPRFNLKAWIAWNKLKYLKKKKNEDLKIAITSYKQIWKLSLLDSKCLEQLAIREHKLV